LGASTRSACEKMWTESQILSNNEKVLAGGTDTSGTPGGTQGTTPGGTSGTTPGGSDTTGIGDDPGDIQWSGAEQVCCGIKTSGSDYYVGDYEKNTGGKFCNQIFEVGDTYNGKSITEITEITNASNRSECEKIWYPDDITYFTPYEGYDPSAGGSGTDGITCNMDAPAGTLSFDLNTFTEKAYLLSESASGIRGKNYALECANDVVYRANLAGVNPNMAMIVWFHETAASNHESFGRLRDFGVEYFRNDHIPESTSEHSYFNEQLNYFVCLTHQGCRDAIPDDPMVAWAASYVTGNACTRSRGESFLNDLKLEWSWFTNNPFPTWVKDSSKDRYCDVIYTYVPLDSGASSSLFDKLFNNKAMAQAIDSSTADSSVLIAGTDDDPYTVYFVEDGIYNVDVDYYSALDVPVNSDKGYRFYVDRNGQEGYQFPQDPNNVADSEDLLVDVRAVQIGVSKVANSFRYEFVKGLNYVSFPFLPSTDGKTSLKASEFIDIASENNDGAIKGIVGFRNGSWQDMYLIDQASGNPSGNDFSITFGKGYVVIANRDMLKDQAIVIPGYSINDPVPISFVDGWNLVGVHGSSQSYSADSLIKSISQSGTISVDNVSWWPQDKAKYEGYQTDPSGEIYGFDFNIYDDIAYFVRVTSISGDSMWTP